MRNSAEATRISIQNRRKQLAQCIWLRRRVDQHLAAGDNLIVLGDFNDGPGLDEYEKLFGRSGVEIVLGKENEEQLFDPHAHLVLSRRIGAAPATAGREQKAGEPRPRQPAFRIPGKGPGWPASLGTTSSCWNEVCTRVHDATSGYAWCTSVQHFQVRIAALPHLQHGPLAPRRAM